ncbi:MAG: hypothetical protein JXB00_07540, partial [Bacteroidales bacterium]|nr:hypothetical protein [Bacteroidales bacterium]
LKEIERRKQLTESIKELRVAYEQLKIQEDFSKDVYIGLVEGGKIYLFELIVKNYPKTLGIPKGLPSSFNIDEYYEIVSKPLTKVKQNLRYSSDQHRLEPFVVNFKGSEPVFTKAEEEAIKEKHRYYAETTEDKKLYDLVFNYCKASNELEKYSKELGIPGISDIWLYVGYLDNEEGNFLAPNPSMFMELAIVKNTKKNHREVQA